MAEARAAIEGDLVDLDLYAAGGGTTYVLTDVRGQTHEVDVPADLPFPLALGLVRAYDGLMDAMTAELDEAEARRRYRRLCQQLSAIAQLVTEGPTSLELQRDFGYERIVTWSNVLITRIQIAQSGTRFERWLAQLLEEREDGPKAPRASAGSSESSGASTGGATTTGGPSAGPSSGRPRASSGSAKANATTPS